MRYQPTANKRINVKRDGGGSGGGDVGGERKKANIGEREGEGRTEERRGKGGEGGGGGGGGGVSLPPNPCGGVGRERGVSPIQCFD